MRTEKNLRKTIEYLDDYMHGRDLGLKEFEQIELVIDSILFCLNEPVKYNEHLFPEPMIVGAEQ